MGQPTTEKKRLVGFFIVKVNGLRRCDEDKSKKFKKWKRIISHSNTRGAFLL